MSLMMSAVLLNGCLSSDDSELSMMVSSQDSTVQMDVGDPSVTVDAAASVDSAIVIEPDQSVSLDAEMPDQLIQDMSVDMGPTSGAYTTAQVDEIFQRDCGSCHNSTASPPLNNGVRAWINRGSGQSRLRLIQPGNHQQSYLYHKLADTHRDPPSNGSGTGMPPGRLLYSESRMERMALWIDGL